MTDKAVFTKNYLKKISILGELIDVGSVVEALTVLERAKREKKTIFIAGNGGSASTASHFVCDLVKMQFKAICLSDNISLLTALANDCSYEEVFSEQLNNFGGKGDLLLAISGSGNSLNIIRAVQTARKLQMHSLAFLGFDGGKVKKMVDSYVLVPANEYGPVEDLHLILNHLLASFFASKKENEK